MNLFYQISIPMNIGIINQELYSGDYGDARALTGRELRHILL